MKLSKCPECGDVVVQMLEREQSKESPYDYSESKHYGFYCKKCKQMYKEKWELIKDEG